MVGGVKLETFFSSYIVIFLFQLEGFEQTVSLQKELHVAIYNRASKTVPSR
jgi:hypothetical protein